MPTQHGRNSMIRTASSTASMLANAGPLYQPLWSIAPGLAYAALAVSLLAGCSSQTDGKPPCDHGWLSIGLDGSTICIPDYPVWGVGPTKPTGLKDNGDGTMSHELTGLSWQVDADVTGFIWSDAVTHCQALNLGGYSDWRLPSAAELSSVLPYWSYESDDPPVPPPSSQSETVSYWSISPDRNCQECAASAYAAGLVGGSAKSSAYSVRCVRGMAQAKEPKQRFSLPTDQTVYDQTSKLTWQQEPSSASFTFDAAQEFCAKNLGKLPGTGWRLPKLREAETILGRYESKAGSPLVMTPLENKLSFWTSTVSAPALLSNTKADVHYRFDFLYSAIADDCASWPGIGCPNTARALCVH